MNPQDSNLKPDIEETQPPTAKADNAKAEISQEEIDQYMRMVGRMLYDIILEWVKKQQGEPQSSANSTLKTLGSAGGREV